MSKLEIAVLIDEAVEHTLKTQKRLLANKEAVNLLPIIDRLNGFAAELGKWRSGKFYLKDMSAHFIKEAESIEDECDVLSEKLWTYIPLALVAICKEIQRVTRQSVEDKTFTKRLKDHYNNIRLGLLEQVAGARLLENNNDLGEEVERVFTQYLACSLGSSTRVVRGGHIYDNEDNRSEHQIDIIITPSDALGFCPANTEEGKFNATIDQVIAAISVKSTLTPGKLEECWKNIQGIPEYIGKGKAYPWLKDEPWPLCFIVAAYAESLEKLEEKWDELRSQPTRHVPQMILILDSGYMIPRDGTWPFRMFKHTSPDVRRVSGLAAGLGLGWLNAGIVGRNRLLSGHAPRWISNLVAKLHQNEAVRAVPASYDHRVDDWHASLLPIHGVLEWGARGMPVHNNLKLSTVLVRRTSELVDPTRPAEKEDFWQVSPYEYRLFRFPIVGKNGKLCALEEWIRPKDRTNCRKRITVFDSETGEEVTDPRFNHLSTVEEFEQINLSNLSISEGSRDF